MATDTNTTFVPVPVLAIEDIVAGVYTLRTNGREVLVDPANKGKPGDLVVLWPKRKPPAIVRRLARCVSYPGERHEPAPASQRYYFVDPATGHMIDLPLNKTAAIHKVVGDL